MRIGFINMALTCWVQERERALPFSLQIEQQYTRALEQWKG